MIIILPMEAILTEYANSNAIVPTLNKLRGHADFPSARTFEARVDSVPQATDRYAHCDYISILFGFYIRGFVIPESGVLEFTRLMESAGIGSLDAMSVTQVELRGTDIHLIIPDTLEERFAEAISRIIKVCIMDQSESPETDPTPEAILVLANALFEDRLNLGIHLRLGWLYRPEDDQAIGLVKAFIWCLSEGTRHKDPDTTEQLAWALYQSALRMNDQLLHNAVSLEGATQYAVLDWFMLAFERFRIVDLDLVVKRYKTHVLDNQTIEIEVVTETTHRLDVHKLINAMMPHRHGSDQS